MTERERKRLLLGKWFRQKREAAGWTSVQMRTKLAGCGVFLGKQGFNKLELRGTDVFPYIEAYGAIFDKTPQQIRRESEALTLDGSEAITRTEERSLVAA